MFRIVIDIENDTNRGRAVVLKFKLILENVSIFLLLHFKLLLNLLVFKIKINLTKSLIQNFFSNQSFIARVFDI